jgi:hypothetical protein
MTRYRISIDLSDIEAEIKAIAEQEDRGYSQTIRLLLKAAIREYSKNQEFLLRGAHDAEQ